jgi:hypothetical protein
VSAKLDELLAQVAAATSDNAAADAVILKLAVEDFVEAARELLAAREVVGPARRVAELLRGMNHDGLDHLDDHDDDPPRCAWCRLVAAVAAHDQDGRPVGVEP